MITVVRPFSLSRRIVSTPSLNFLTASHSVRGREDSGSNRGMRPLRRMNSPARWLESSTAAAAWFAAFPPGCMLTPASEASPPSCEASDETLAIPRSRTSVMLISARK